MTYAELRKEVDRVSKDCDSQTRVFEDGEWLYRDCCAFTISRDLDVLITKPVSYLQIDETAFNVYVEFLSTLHPLYRRMLDCKSPSVNSPEIHLNFNHSLLNYRMQVLWRYLWAAPWNVYVLNYLFLNGFTPAESLVILGINPNPAGKQATPYHILQPGIQVSPEILIENLENLEDFDPCESGLQHNFIHKEDSEWVRAGKDMKERSERSEALSLRNYEREGIITNTTFLDDLEHLDRLRDWVGQFK